MKLDGALLAEAFPATLRDEALAAGMVTARYLHQRQWTERFAVQVEGEAVLIPARLHFKSRSDDPSVSGAAWLMARSLQTRSNDGFERQRAVRDILAEVQPWSAPFVVALIGEYVVEILLDIEAAMSPRLSRALADFIAANPCYWETIKQRITSYWDVYYRRTYSRSVYVGFRLIDQLEAERARAIA